MSISDFKVLVASSVHVKYAKMICDEMAESAMKRGTGIAKRSVDYVASKMIEGKAIIALSTDGGWAGFTYIESWEDERYVANSGLIINPQFRNLGLAKVIKRKAFALSRHKFANAKLFGLTTGLAVMKINSELGYRPVTFNQLTQDEKFWKGCECCVNYDILKIKDFSNCLCTAMIFDSSVDVMRFSIEEVLQKEVFTISELKIKNY